MDKNESNNQLNISLAYDGKVFEGAYTAKKISGRGALGDSVDDLLNVIGEVLNDSSDSINVVTLSGRVYYRGFSGIGENIPRAPKEILDKVAVNARVMYKGIEFLVV
ncbi:hypothetical protein HOL21_04270 [Candidatus Woesearchaeota archaeon]|jgi:hypothetical protein|nr:hypothetical protein [Candidatus Woesearchaeota archaeon]MBT5397402.1 hypothetical protein [Candidatus Woesearchaeota archaeon]MBT5924730.1 hypothetical protein [Candidatus Woesearchaeota archaeon]MBT7762802.1 hypothetical protein [Candidatus Woesearchaeota archaeon]